MMALRKLSNSADPADRTRLGLTVAIALAVFTILEYIVAVASVPFLVVWLLIMAVAKAWLIVEFFMHVRQIREGRH